MLNTVKSEELYKIALDLMPGGVNSPVRAFGAVGRNPLFIDHAKGSYVYDVDGNKFIDYVCSWGPGILGHSHPEVLEDVVIAGFESACTACAGMCAIHGNDAYGKFRNRGYDECDSCCQRIYWKR